MLWTPTQRWIIAVAAPLFERNRWGHEFIGGAPRSKKLDPEARESLTDSWGVWNRTQLLATLKDLQTDDEDQIEGLLTLRGDQDERAVRRPVIEEHGATLRAKGPVAWNHVRCVAVAGWGYRTGWLKEVEYFEIGLASALRVQSTYESFEELGLHYGHCHALWSGDSDLKAKVDAALERLLTETTSPWRRNEWSHPLTLTGEEKLFPAGPATSSTSTVVETRTALTEAQRFALTTISLFKVLDYEPLNRLEGMPFVDASSWKALTTLHESLREKQALHKNIEGLLADDVDSFRQVYEDFAKKVEQVGSLEEALPDAGQARQIGYFMAHGWERLKQAMHGFRLYWAGFFVEKGFQARLFTVSEAWSLLFLAARRCQRWFDSWEEAWSSALEGQFVVNGQERRPVDEDSLRLLLEDPMSPCHQPFNVDLDQVIPLKLPEQFDVMSIRLAMLCPACYADVRVPHIASEVECEVCGEVIPLADEHWERLLDRSLYHERRRRTPGWTLVRSDDPHAIHSRSWEPLTCDGCGEPLDVRAALSEPGRHPFERAMCELETSFTIRCGKCEREHAAWLPGNRTRAVAPDAVCVVEREQVGDGVGSVVTRCSLCAAPIQARPHQRVLSCPDCQAANTLSLEQYRTLTPAPIRGFSVVCLPEPRTLPIDHPEVSHFQLRNGFVAHAGCALEHAGFAPSPRGYDPAPPDPPLTRLQQFVNRLASLDLYRTGADPERRCGLPRFAPERIDAHQRLAQRLDQEVNEASVTAALHDALAAAEAASPNKTQLAAAISSALSLARDGQLLGSISAATADETLLPLAEFVQSTYADFDDWELALLRSGEEEARSKAREQRDAEALWPSISFGAPLDGPAEQAPAATHDVVYVEVRLRCAACLETFNLAHWQEPTSCPHCRTLHDVTSYGLGAALAPIVYSARHLPPNEEERTTDFWPRTFFEFCYRRGTLDCLRCGQALPMSLALNAVGKSFACPGCHAQTEVRPPDETLTGVEPRIVGALVPSPVPGSGAEHVNCAHCGAALEASGASRIVACEYCDQQSLLTDESWLRLHPTPPPLPLTFLCSRAYAEPHRLADRDTSSRYFTLQGHPARIHSAS